MQSRGGAGKSNIAPIELIKSTTYRLLWGCRHPHIGCGRWNSIHTEEIYCSPVCMHIATAPPQEGSATTRYCLRTTATLEQQAGIHM